MSNTNIAYDFEFFSSFDEDVFNMCPFATQNLRSKVVSALETQRRFLDRFTQVNRIAQQVSDDGRRFRIILSRS
jgi:hypothetical protein